MWTGPSFFKAQRNASATTPGAGTGPDIVGTIHPALRRDELHRGRVGP
jgi:hypothetical protein